jgi:hypothetical protein
MDFRTAQIAYQDGSIFNADLPTLRAYLHVVNQQQPHADPRYHQIATTIQALIDERQKQTRHQITLQQAKDQHQQIQGQIGNISDELAKVKIQLNDLKGTLRKSHRVHLWIFGIAVVTAIIASIAAADSILRWIRGE